MKSRNDDTIVKKVVDESTGEERIITLQQSHAKPTSRRDFLATGILGFSGYVLAPSILNVLARPEFAMAADAQCAVSGTGMPAFIHVNLSGGASLSSNAPPLGQDRNPLAKYDLLGLGADNLFLTDDARSHTAFQGVRLSGNKNAGTPAGHFWLGLSQAASAAALDKTSFVCVCVTSGDDSSNNPASVIGLVSAAGVNGDLLPSLGSRDGTGSGVGQIPAIIKPDAPLVVRSYADIESALKPAGSLASRLSEGRRRKLLELVNSLSGSQARAIAAVGSATGTKLAQVVECATGKNIELASKADPGIDPGLNSAVATVWGITAGNKNGGTYAQAAMVYNALKGNSAVTGIDLGGYDYHGAGRATQNTKDADAGRMVGRIIESANALGKPVMIHVTSDGSVSSGSGSAFGGDFNNDSGNRGQTWVFAYDPNGRPAMKNDQFKHQVGYFTNGQGATDQSAVGSVEKAAACVFANYLAFAKQSAKFDSIAPGVFQRADMDEVIRFA